MKKLELNQLARINGGSFWGSVLTFVGGACAGWYAAGAVAHVLAYSNPVSGTAAGIADGICITTAIVGGYVLASE